MGFNDTTIKRHKPKAGTAESDAHRHEKSPTLTVYLQTSRLNPYRSKLTLRRNS
jgi:hypothetical protein